MCLWGLKRTEERDAKYRSSSPIPLSCVCVGEVENVCNEGLFLRAEAKVKLRLRLRD